MCDSSCLKKYWKTYPSGAMCSWKLTDPSLTKGSKTDDPSPPCSVPPHPPIPFDQSPSLRTLRYLRRGLCKSGTNYCCKGPGKRGHIVADTLLPMMFLGLRKLGTFVADTKCFWTKSETFFVSRTQNLCPQQMFRARANGETFVSATVTDAFKSRSYLEDFSVILYIATNETLTRSRLFGRFISTCLILFFSWLWR